MTGTGVQLSNVEALLRVRALWPESVNGCFIGCDGPNVMVGFIRLSKRAIRFTGRTWDEALVKAELWTRQNPGRMESWDGSHVAMGPVARSASVDGSAGAGTGGASG